MSRKRGGQPGNTNALKHGFYSRQFRSLEMDDLGEINSGLESEIAMLRVQMRRTLEIAEAAQDGEASKLGTVIKTLYVLGATASRIASLMKAQAILTGNDNETTDIITAALEEITTELGLWNE